MSFVYYCLVIYFYPSKTLMSTVKFYYFLAGIGIIKSCLWVALILSKLIWFLGWKDFWTLLSLLTLKYNIMQFLHVFAPKYETAGKFWPIVHNSTIFSLVLMQIIALGIFVLKKVNTAASTIVPLIIFTLLFNEYCRKRFLPNFVAYSAEVCLHIICSCQGINSIHYQFLP